METMETMDKICIEGLEIMACHGVFAGEKQTPQRFVVSAALAMDTRPAGRSDDLAASVDYGQAAHLIESFVREHTFDLVETIAERLAELLLDTFPMVEQVWLRVEKPDAPVGLPLKTVAVEITRSRHRAYIALGSNMGDRSGYLQGAVKALDQLAGCRVTAVSDFIETEPYGYTEQAPFLNGCLALETLLPPEELLSELQRIEQEAGRRRSIHWGPRTLDLDIVLYDQLVMDTQKLRIPHTDMHNRTFVLRPLAQIAPYAWHPLLHKTAVQLLEGLETPEQQGQQK